MIAIRILHNHTSIFVLNILNALRFIVLIVLLLWFNPARIFGQGFPFLQHFDVEEFGGFQQVWDFAQDSSGILYIGNGSGILTFDGVRWKNHHIPNATHVMSLLQAQDGTIYYGSENEIGFLSRDSLHQLVPRSLKDHLNEQVYIGDVYRIHELKGVLYFETKQGFIVKERKNLRHIPIQQGVISSLVVNDDLYFQAENGMVFRYKESGIEQTGIKVDSEMDFISHLAIDGDKISLISRENGFIKKLGTSQEYLSLGRTFNKEILKKNEFAIASMDSGIYIIKDHAISQQYKAHENEEGLRNQITYNVYADKEDNLWVATYDGITKISQTIPIRFFRENAGIDTEIIDLAQHNDQVYIAGFSGLFRTDSDQNELTFTTIDEVIRFDLFSMGDYLLAAGLDGVSIFKEGVVMKTIFSSTSRAVVAIEKPNSMAVYIAGSSALIEMIFDKDFNRLLSTKELHSGLVTQLKVHEENIWFKDYTQGLFRVSLDDYSKKNYALSDITASETEWIGNIDKQIHVGTQNGLRFYSASLDSFISVSGYPKDVTTKQVFRFQETADGNVWVVNDRKLKKIDLSGNTSAAQHRLFNLLDAQNTIYALLEVDETLWLGTKDGITIIEDPDWKSTADFSTNITNAYLNTDSLIYGGFGNQNSTLEIPYSKNELRFTYAASSFIDPQKNTFSYKLEGFDERWSEWSTETQKDYTNIPEGEYIFQVRSRNVFGNEGAMDTYGFEILPPWYRTWWAYLLYLIVGNSILYSAYKIRVNQLLRVERMRTKIASDLHDEVSATLTGISYFAEAVKTDANAERKTHFINLISESAGDAKEKITDIVWSITPENDNWSLFLAKCRRYASDLLESKGVKYELKITTEIEGKLTMNARQHLWMMFKEILTNAVRHSKAKRVDVIMDTDQHLFRIIIQDDGIGFNKEKETFGNGLTNIEKRGAEIKAKVSVESEEGMGTRWRIEYPL